MKLFKRYFCILLCLLLCFSGTAYAHSGRTDASGGHRDNKNASGLGYYHYHCGGHPAHLHSNGTCPYSGGNTSGSSTSSGTTAKKPTLNKKKATVAAGATITLKVKNTSQNKITWTSTKKKVATVSKSGKITGKKAGTTTIKATVNNTTLKCKVKVVMPRLNRTTLSGEVYGYSQLKVKNATATVKWSSSNPSIASVDSDGWVDFNKVGSATITARTGKKKFKCKVTVYGPFIDDDIDLDY